MISVRVRRAQDGFPEFFQVAGHAGYAESGSDIVCAAVSGIAQTAVLGVSELTSLDVDVKMKKGLLTCVLTRGSGGTRKAPVESREDEAKAKAIVEAALLGLRRISEQYPDRLEIVEQRI